MGVKSRTGKRKFANMFRSPKPLHDQQFVPGANQLNNFYTQCFSISKLYN